MSVKEARAFAGRWLPAWTGNDPERLAAFYAEDAFYLDPGIPGGVRGKAGLLSYFGKLLAYNPDWVWSLMEAIPMEGGFLNKWHAKIPVGPETVECVGVCLVILNEEGLIQRNEVYFDRSRLLETIQWVKARD